MVLLTCCRREPNVLLSPSSSGELPGVCLLRHLLRAACTAREGSDESATATSAGAEWLPLLLGEVAGSGRTLQLLFCALDSSPGSQQGALMARTAEQACLLHVMAEAVELRYGSAAAEDHTMVCACVLHAHAVGPWPHWTPHLLCTSGVVLG
jgi:hypothetical protein